MKYARWFGLAALVLFALPAVVLTCYMLGRFGPQMTVALWIHLVYDFFCGVLA